MGSDTSTRYGLVFLGYFFLIACTWSESTLTSRDNDPILSINELFRFDEDLNISASSSKTAAVIIPTSSSPKTSSLSKGSKASSSKGNQANNARGSPDGSQAGRPVKYVKISVRPPATPETVAQILEPIIFNAPQEDKRPPPTTKLQSPREPSPHKRKPAGGESGADKLSTPDRDDEIHVASIVEFPSEPIIVTPKPKPFRSWTTTPSSFRPSTPANHPKASSAGGSDSPIRPTVRSRVTSRPAIPTISRTRNYNLHRSTTTPLPQGEREKHSRFQDPPVVPENRKDSKAFQQLQPIFKPMLQAFNPTLSPSAPSPSPDQAEHNKQAKNQVLTSQLSNNPIEEDQPIDSLEEIQQNRTPHDSSEMVLKPQVETVPSIRQRSPDSITDILEQMERREKEKESQHQSAGIPDFKEHREQKGDDSEFIRPRPSANTRPRTRPDTKIEALSPRIKNQPRHQEDIIIDLEDLSSVRPPKNYETQHPGFRPRPSLREPVVDDGDRLSISQRDREPQSNHSNDNKNSRPIPIFQTVPPIGDGLDDFDAGFAFRTSPARVHPEPTYDDRPLQQPAPRSRPTNSESFPNQRPNYDFPRKDETRTRPPTSSPDDLKEDLHVEVPLHMLKELLMNVKRNITKVAIHSDYDPEPKIIRAPVLSPGVAARPPRPLSDESEFAHDNRHTVNHHALTVSALDKSRDKERTREPIYRRVSSTTPLPLTISTSQGPIRIFNPVTNKPLFPDHPDAMVLPPPKEFLDRYQSNRNTPSTTPLYEDEEEIVQFPQRGRLPPRITSEEDLPEEPEDYFGTSDEEDFARVTLPPSNYGKKIQDLPQFTTNRQEKVPILPLREDRDRERHSYTERPVNKLQENQRHHELNLQSVRFDENNQPTYPRITASPTIPRPNEDFIVASTPLPLSRPTATPFPNNEPKDHRESHFQRSEPKDHESVHDYRRPFLSSEENHGDPNMDEIRTQYQEAERVHRITPEPPSRIYRPPHKEFERSWLTPTTRSPSPPVNFSSHEERNRLAAAVTVRPHNLVYENNFRPVAPNPLHIQVTNDSTREIRPPHRQPLAQEPIRSSPRPPSYTESPIRPLFRPSEQEEEREGRDRLRVPESQDYRTHNSNHYPNRRPNEDVTQRPESIHELRRGNVHEGLRESERPHGIREPESGRSHLSHEGVQIHDLRRGNIQEERRKPAEHDPPTPIYHLQTNDRDRIPSFRESLSNREPSHSNRPKHGQSVEQQVTRPPNRPDFELELPRPQSHTNEEVRRRPSFNVRDAEDLEYRIHTAKDHRKHNRVPEAEHETENPAEDNSYKPPYVPLNVTRLQSFTYSDEDSKPKYDPDRHRHDKSFPLLAPPPPVTLVPEKPIFASDDKNEVVNIPVNKDYAEHQTNLRQQLQNAARATPKSSFRCEKMLNPGYYADVGAKCQVFHFCQADNIRSTFVCPPGTLFNQRYRVCDWWYNVDCENSPDFYFLNDFYGSDSKGR